MCHARLSAPVTGLPGWSLRALVALLIESAPPATCGFSSVLFIRVLGFNAVQFPPDKPAAGDHSKSFSVDLATR